MQGYKLTQEQAEQLQGQKYAPDSFFNPVKDKKEDYFIFQEVEQCTNEKFAWVKKLQLFDFWNIDYTPPTLSNIGVIIPEKFEWVFANDRFEINGFVVDFARVNGQLAVDVAYLLWEAFQNELDLPTNATVKASLMPIWKHVETDFELGNIVRL